MGHGLRGTRPGRGGHDARIKLNDRREEDRREVPVMALTREQLLAKRPVDRERVDAYKANMLGEARAYQLLELREALGPTRQELAKRIGVGQWQVSKLERGDLDRARLGTRSRRRRSGRRVRCRRSATPGGVRLSLRLARLSIIAAQAAAFSVLLSGCSQLFLDDGKAEAGSLRAVVDDLPGVERVDRFGSAQSVTYSASARYVVHMAATASAEHFRAVLLAWHAEASIRDDGDGIRRSLEGGD